VISEVHAWVESLQSLASRIQCPPLASRAH